MASSKREQLFHLMQNQEAKRVDVFRHWELDELGAMKKLAFSLYGERSLLEMNPGEPGVIYIGCYDRVYPRSVPSARRKRVLVLRGRSFAELQAQAKLVRS